MPWGAARLSRSPPRTIERSHPEQSARSRNGRQPFPPRQAALAKRGRATRYEQAQCRGRGGAPRRESRLRQGPRQRRAPKNPREQRRGRSLRFALRCRDDRVEPIAVEAAHRRPVKQGGGGKSAIAEAVNGFDVEAGIFVLAVDLDPVMEFKIRDKVFATHGLTRFGATKLQHPAIKRRAVEIMIKADHAKRFGSRDIQRVRYKRDRGVVDVTKLLLQIVQDWQRGSWRVALTVD